MHFHDLTSMDAVNDLPMPEFNLRVHCIMEEQGAGITLPEDFQPARSESKRLAPMQLKQMLAEMKLKKLADQRQEGGREKCQ